MREAERSPWDGHWSGDGEQTASTTSQKRKEKLSGGRPPNKQKMIFHITAKSWNSLLQRTGTFA